MGLELGLVAASGIQVRLLEGFLVRLGRRLGANEMAPLAEASPRGVLVAQAGRHGDEHGIEEPSGGVALL